MVGFVLRRQRHSRPAADNHPLQWTGPGVDLRSGHAAIVVTGRPRPLNGFALVGLGHAHGDSKRNPSATGSIVLVDRRFHRRVARMGIWPVDRYSLAHFDCVSISFIDDLVQHRKADLSVVW